jgi:hypothetical protein
MLEIPHPTVNWLIDCNIYIIEAEGVWKKSEFVFNFGRTNDLGSAEKIG